MVFHESWELYHYNPLPHFTTSPPSLNSFVGSGSLADLLAPKELRLEELLGTGSTAEVYRAAWHGTDVAVKKLRSKGATKPRERRSDLSVRPHDQAMGGRKTIGGRVQSGGAWGNMMENEKNPDFYKTVKTCKNHRY